MCTGRQECPGGELGTRPGWDFSSQGVPRGSNHSQCPASAQAPTPSLCLCSPTPPAHSPAVCTDSALPSSSLLAASVPGLCENAPGSRSPQHTPRSWCCSPKGPQLARGAYQNAHVRPSYPVVPRGENSPWVPGCLPAPTLVEGLAPRSPTHHLTIHAPITTIPFQAQPVAPAPAACMPNHTTLLPLHDPRHVLEQCRWVLARREPG